MFAFRMMHVHFIHKIIELYYANKMSMYYIIPKVKGHMEHNHSMLYPIGLYLMVLLACTCSHSLLIWYKMMKVTA